MSKLDELNTTGEGDEAIYFAYSAMLRVFGDGVPFEEISQKLAVLPTHVHRKGELRNAKATPYPHDMWSFSPDLPKVVALEQHIDALWSTVRPQVEFLKSLKTRFSVDVFLGYRSSCDHAGFEVSHKSLEIFSVLEVPFGVSVIIA